VRRRARFFGRNADVPTMLIAVGDGPRIARVLPELGGLLRRPLGRSRARVQSAPGMTDRPLWAPWRIEYIKGPKAGECVFCNAAAADDDARVHVVARGERCFALLNTYPYASGHLMVAPYRHVPGLADLDDGELLELMTLTRRCLDALREGFGPEGFNIGINQGKPAGAGIADHLHQHVVPRWEGDTNFMPVVGDTRVLPQALSEARDVLVATLRA
jgi:ATP adenylyltransferase